MSDSTSALPLVSKTSGSPHEEEEVQCGSGPSLHGLEAILDSHLDD